ncbi:AAA family ATPase [Thermoproteus tenax]|uniref:Purine NTPase n=1 Tax=Thermoproteus tenax (strain ATCC 35583 / DSM 2078 / JCM 9277 / NBRC 100435 / Kra 1) TaxID=768679 RepID=G4RJV4_THETK|nr:SMC family ATPase [Thermoproteus tenax]CCC81849.1 purine NTPase [Thermoproteus tenax Kra 1]
MLKWIEVRNFKAHEEFSTDFVEGVNFIYGPNGAGKSSLLEAVAVALYGSKWLQKIKAKWSDLVRRGAPEASVELSFVGLDGVEYTVVRRFSPAGSSPSGTYILAEGRQIARGDQEVTAAAARALGIGVEEFANLVYIRQGELRRILAEPDYIDRLFRLDEFDDLDEIVREITGEVSRRRARAEGRAEELAKRAEALRGQAERLKAELAEARAEAERLRASFEQFKAVDAQYSELKERAAALEQEARALRAEAERLEEELVSLDIDREKKAEELAELARLEEELRALPEPDRSAEAQYYELKRAVELLSSAPEARKFKPEDLEAALRERDEAAARISEIAARLKLLKDVVRIAGSSSGGRCPVCGGPLSQETVERHKREAERLEEELRRLEARKAELDAAVRRLERAREEYLRVKDYLSLDLDEAKRRLAELREAYERSKALERRRAEIAGRLASRGRLEEELRRLEAKRAEEERRLGQVRARLSEVEAELSRIKPALEEAAKRREELRALAESYLRASSRAEELERQLRQTAEELSKSARELEAARAEAKAHAEAESRGNAVRSALREVKPLARRILTEAVNAELNSIFLKLRHKESFRAAELAQEGGRYYVVVARSDGQRFSHTALSLGEVNLLALALRLALAKALLGRPPFMILDEPTEHLDEIHRQRIVELVRDLAREVRTVVVTSHLGEFEEVADKRIDL